ncbi:MAG TPA: response regulator [Acetobacteraceae bacterium]|jgi:CheY-like chemotaxis protein
MDKRLLIVDDDAGLTRIVALTANTLAISATQINDPRRALDSFVQLRPQVVILDIFMPEQDGIDVLDEILLTGIPTQVVLTTGDGDELLRLAQDAIRFHGRPEAPVLQKPFRRAELVEVLGRVFG